MDFVQKPQNGHLILTKASAKNWNMKQTKYEIRNKTKDLSSIYPSQKEYKKKKNHTKNH